MVRKKCLSFRPPRLRYFCYGSQNRLPERPFPCHSCSQLSARLSAPCPALLGSSSSVNHHALCREGRSHPQLLSSLTYNCWSTQISQGKASVFHPGPTRGNHPSTRAPTLTMSFRLSSPKILLTAQLPSAHAGQRSYLVSS